MLTYKDKHLHTAEVDLVTQVFAKETFTMMENTENDKSVAEESEVVDKREAKYLLPDNKKPVVKDAVTTLKRKGTVPVDRDWAWFVLLGAFLNMLLLIGIIKCSGILFVAFQERYGSSSSMTSLLSTVENIFQSITSLLAMTFGIRITTCRNMLFLGSIITSTAYIITSQAADIRLLLFSYGALQGIGMGLMFTTATNMVNHYFEKRRGFANSISVSGGSIGGLLFAPMITKLLTTYGYQGCLLIIAGLLLNGCVIAALLRPTSFYTNTACVYETILPSKCELKEQLSAKSCIDGEDKQLDFEIATKDSNGKVHSGSTDEIPTTSKQNMKTLYDETEEECKSHRSMSDISTEEYRESRLPADLTSSESASFIEKNNQSCRMRNASENALTKDKHVEIPKEGMKGLLKNPVLWVILLQGSLICSGTLVAPIFIAPYAKDIGLTADEIATLVTALSCVDLFSRLAIGYISDKGWLKSSSIIAIAALVISCSTSLLRFYTSFAALLVYATVLGVVSGAYFSLYAVVLIDYLTLDNFHTCLGIIALVHGFSIAGVFYIIGYLRDLTGSYVIPHNVIGVTTGVGAIVLFLLPVIERMQK